MDDSQTVEPTVGMLVFTSDGDELGRIKALEGDCFEIDVQMGMDFWLGKATIASTEFGVARLKIAKSVFNQHPDTDARRTRVDADDSPIPLGHSYLGARGGMHQH